MVYMQVLLLDYIETDKVEFIIFIVLLYTKKTLTNLS